MKNATAPKTGKKIYFKAIFYLVLIKNSENLVPLMLEFKDVKGKGPMEPTACCLQTNRMVQRS